MPQRSSSNPAARVHQARALEEAAVLDQMSHVPPQARRAQAARVFQELKAMTRAETSGVEQPKAGPWWVDD